MRYWKRKQAGIVTVYRYNHSPILTERYDPKTKEWVDFPDIIGVIVGHGVRNEYIPITEDEAQEIING